MGKLQEFTITFTDNKVVYGPGESMSGNVKIRTSSSLPYKAIKVNCVGSCGISNKINDASWTLEEQYFNSTLSVADKGILAVGEHAFQFRFLIPGLPPDILRDLFEGVVPGELAHCLKVAVPTSFEGSYGKILYRVRALIDTPRFSKDYKAQRPFYLLNMLNLNEVSGIEHQNTAVMTKKFSYHLVKTGTMMLKARTDMKGYIPGQVIKLAAEIHNKSGKDTGCVLASLIQKVTYKTKRPMFDLRTIAEVEGAGVKAGKHAEWKEQIIVPPLPQSVLDGCSLINIDYAIQVSLKSPEAVVVLPIYIGNIALNLSPSGLVPSSPDSCGLTGVLSAARVTPSAPPVEEDAEDMLCAGGLASEEIPTKSHSQQDASGQLVTMSLRNFSPGAAVPLSYIQPAPLFCVSTGATIPFFTESNVTPVPTSCSLILPPEYSSWDYPHEPPPSYDESCSSADSSFNSRQ